MILTKPNDYNYLVDGIHVGGLAKLQTYPETPDNELTIKGVKPFKAEKPEEFPQVKLKAKLQNQLNKIQDMQREAFNKKLEFLQEKLQMQKENDKILRLMNLQKNYLMQGMVDELLDKMRLSEQKRINEINKGLLESSEDINKIIKERNELNLSQFKDKRVVEKERIIEKEKEVYVEDPKLKEEYELLEAELIRSEEEKLLSEEEMKSLESKFLSSEEERKRTAKELEVAKSKEYDIVLQRKLERTDLNKVRRDLSEQLEKKILELPVQSKILEDIKNYQKLHKIPVEDWRDIDKIKENPLLKTDYKGLEKIMLNKVEIDKSLENAKKIGINVDKEIDEMNFKKHNISNTKQKLSIRLGVIQSLRDKYFNYIQSLGLTTNELFDAYELQLDLYKDLKTQLDDVGAYKSINNNFMALSLDEIKGRINNPYFDLIKKYPLEEQTISGRFEEEGHAR